MAQLLLRALLPPQSKQKLCQHQTHLDAARLELNGTLHDLDGFLAAALAAVQCRQERYRVLVRRRPGHRALRVVVRPALVSCAKPGNATYRQQVRIRRRHLQTRPDDRQRPLIVPRQDAKPRQMGTCLQVLQVELHGSPIHVGGLAEPPAFLGGLARQQTRVGAAGLYVECVTKRHPRALAIAGLHECLALLQIAFPARLRAVARREQHRREQQRNDPRTAHIRIRMLMARQKPNAPIAASRRMVGE